MPDKEPSGGSDSGGYGVSWYAAHAVASPPRPKLAVETDVDVCVVGGGLAGLTVAREVARRGWSVLLLESKSVAWNASGRNSGVVLPGYAVSAEALVERLGPDHARKLWTLSEAGAEYVRNTIRDTAMPGAELNEGGWLHVSKTDRNVAMVTRFDVLTAVLGAAVEAWPVERVRHELRSQHYFEAMHFPRGFSINPLNYALGLAAAAEAAGVRICEDTPALQIDPVGVRKRIIVQGSRVRAAHVVLAGNVHIGGLMPEFAATLVPTHRYAIVTEPLSRALRESIRTRAAVSDDELAYSHYRVVDRNRLLWSGRSTAWRGKPQHHAGALLREIARTYPALRGIKAEYAWTGTLGSTVHRMPQIGEISPGLWLLSGFGGHGINTTAMAGELLARAIVEGDGTWQLFQPFGMVWAGGAFGRMTQQTTTWSLRAHGRIASWLSRRREARLGPLEPLSVAAEIMDPVPLAEPEWPVVATPAPPEPAPQPQADVPSPPDDGPAVEALPPASPDAAPQPSDAEATPAADEMPQPPRSQRRKRRKRSQPVAAEAAGPSGDPPADGSV